MISTSCWGWPDVTTMRGRFVRATPGLRRLITPSSRALKIPNSPDLPPGLLSLGQLTLSVSLRDVRSIVTQDHLRGLEPEFGSDFSADRVADLIR